MSKYFIKVSKRYATKNKLQKLCLEHLQKLDHSLYPDLDQVKNDILNNYNNAYNEYKGNAQVPILHINDHSQNTVVFFIEDVIYIDAYKVLN